MPLDPDIKNDFMKFVETTGLRGVPRIVKSSHSLTKALWLTSFIVCLIMMIYQTTTLLVNFNNNDVTTHFNENQTKPEFPDVTICNNNPYDAFQKFEGSYNEYISKLLHLKRFFVNKNNTNETVPIPPSAMWSELGSKSGYIVNNPRFAKRRYSSLDTFIVDHLWYDWQFGENEIDLNFEDIKVNWHPQYYTCYTIVPPNVTGGILGFSAILFIDNFPPKPREFFKFYVELAMVTGVRLKVHPHGTEPYMDEGITIAPGTETTIQVAQTNIERLPEPWGNCTDERYLKLASDIPYSRSSCQSLCRQMRYYYPTCNCLVAYEVYTDAMTNYSFCSNISMFEINESNLSDILKNPICDANTWATSDICDCRLPCTEKKYDIKVTQVAWPSLTSHLEFYENYIQSRKDIYGDKFDLYQQILDSMDNMTTSEVLKTLELENLIGKNFLQVNVRLDEEIVNQVREKPSTTWVTVLANVGGTLNFWLGITVFFIAELLEFVCHFAIAKRCSSRLQFWIRECLIRQKWL